MATSEQHQERPEAKGPSHAAEFPSKAVQEALNQYHVCGDGRVVTNPKDCHGANILPTMSVGDLSKT